MRIVIMGAGGLGGYFGARLAAAGNDVAFVARGAHLAAIRQDGLRVESAHGNLHLCEDYVAFEWERPEGSDLVAPLVTDFTRTTQVMFLEC